MLDSKLRNNLHQNKFLLNHSSIYLKKKRSQCFCGNTYGAYGVSGNCKSLCNGASNEICGGSWANSVYSTLSSISFKRKLLKVVQ
jgi:hypothetical protein